MKRKIIVITAFICFLLISSMNVSSLNISDAKESIKDKKQKIETQNAANNYALTIWGYGGDGILLEHHKAAAERVDGYFSSRGDYETQILGRPFLWQVSNAIVNDIPNKLGNNKQIFIMITCHGNSGGGLHMQRLIAINPGKLAEWIGDMEENLESLGKTYSCLTIFINTCYAGIHQSFLRNSTKNRIIITSTDSDSHSYYDGYNGEEWFIEEFFDSLENGNSYGRAWEDADALIDDGLHPASQNPKISDDYGIVGTNEPDTLYLNNRLSLRASPSGVKEKAKNLKNYPGIFEIFEKILDRDSQIFYKIKHIINQFRNVNNIISI